MSEQFVSLEDGTGLVHTAPGHGKEDYRAGREGGIPALSPLNLDGTFTKDAGFLEGKFAKDADEIIVKEFENKNAIFGKENIVHDYPLCWRCETPLLMLSVPQWFFKVSDFRQKLLNENKKVNWVPKWAGKRFDNWLESLDDWPISRQRYWGIPLPIWTCEKCDKIKVIGSMDELPKKIEDIHRPYIDKVTLDCECGGEMKRVEDVLDVWFDSGVCSWASLGYPKEKKLFDEMWPPDFITEGPDQIRGWWNSQMITSMIAFEQRPFKNVLFHGFILDAHGIKMSKSKGNVVSPEDVIEKHGRDVLRFYFLKTDPSNDFYFKWEDVKEVLKFFTVLYNSVNFFNIYCKKEKLNGLKKEDKWIISRVNSLVKNSIKYNKSYNGFKATEMLENFVLEDLSHWYIKLIRNRTWPAYDKDDKKAAFATLYYVIDKLLKILAPICPFLSEDFYQEIIKGDSVHLEDYPKEEKIDEKLEKQMEVVKKVVELSNSTRHKEKIRLRYTLQTLTVTGKKEDIEAVKNLKEIIKKIANVKEVKTKEGESKIELYTKASEELKKEWLLKELIRNIQSKRKKMKLDVKERIKLFLPEVFKDSAKTISGATGSEITFGEVSGDKTEFKFENKKYEFGIL
jgi:isoleucyl-tRNA synthetase